MKKLCKFVSIIFLGVLLLSLLCGCQDKLPEGKIRITFDFGKYTEELVVDEGTAVSNEDI